MGRSFVYYKVVDTSNVIPQYTSRLWMTMNSIKFEYSNNQPVVPDADL